MCYSKYKLFLAKSLQLIIWLTVLILIYFVAISINNEKESKYCYPEHLDKYLYSDGTLAVSNTGSDAVGLAARLQQRNQRREVSNVREFGPDGDSYAPGTLPVRPEAPVLVVSGRGGLAPLRQLVASLAQVAGLDDLLLVFSHAHYDDRIDHLIRQIDFCMVLQIFYPHSVQLNPGVFPGSEPAAEGTGGREPKHHWWWTAHYVFGQLAAAGPTPHTGTVVFLDERDYVLPDLMSVLSAAGHALSLYPDAQVIALGRSGVATAADYSRLTLQPWRAAHGAGLAFGAGTWAAITALGWRYCQFDDTGWSRSLEHLFLGFPGGRALAVAALAARVLPATVLPRDRADLCALTHRRRLFPRRLHALVHYARGGRARGPPAPAPAPARGGWADPRDVFLCYTFTDTEENVTTTY